jgi:hypothetical protein
MTDSIDKIKCRAEFAEQRSHADFASATEFTKILVQLLVAGGGIASTSLLTLAGVLKDQHQFIKSVIFPGAGFLFCVICGVLAALNFAETQGAWGRNWQYLANEQTVLAEQARSDAVKFGKKAKNLIIYGLYAFVVGSVVAGALIYFAV